MLPVAELVAVALQKGLTKPFETQPQTRCTITKNGVIRATDGVIRATDGVIRATDGVIRATDGVIKATDGVIRAAWY